MLAKITQLIKSYKLPILSGLLIGTSYVPFPPWATLFCMVPLWMFWIENIEGSWKKIFFSGWLSGFLLTAIGFNWISFTIHEFGHFPWVISILGFLIFCGFANLDLALAGLSVWGLKKIFRLPKLAVILLFPVITAMYEAHFPSIFEWNYGYSFFWSKIPIYNLAEIIGFQGLSSLVILLNLLIFLAFQKGFDRRKYFLTAIASFILLNLAGWVLSISLAPPDRVANIGIVQANIGNLEKQFAEKGLGFREYILERYADLSKQLVTTKKAKEEKFDFLVWPETAFPSTIYDTGLGDGHVYKLKAFVKEIGVPLITGGYGFEQASQKPKNAIFTINADGDISPHHYVKTHLLAFGEYIPGVEIFPKLRDLIPASEFARGNGPEIFEFLDYKLGFQICYESLFPKFTRGLANKGAQIIVNVTNDSWYGTWAEPFQHMVMTLARAVEVRRPLIRSTNTGISTVVLASGQVLEKSPQASEWSGHYVIPYFENPMMTLYQKFPWLMDFLLLISLLLILWRGNLGRPKRS